MIYGSVCSGIEAASVAWHPLGWEASFVSEIDNFPRAVLAHHYPEVPLHGDFTTIQDGDYQPIDLLVGGTPCQSFSVAGLRGGLDDDRGNLALEFLKLAQRLRPRWVVWENVPGVLSSNGGRDFGSILAGLGEVGYGFAYRVLDAQYFGLAQRRKRVFVVGYLGDWRRAAAVLFEREGLRGDTAPSRQKGKRIAPTLDVRAGRSGETTFHTSGGLIEHLAARSGSALCAPDIQTYLPIRNQIGVGVVYPTHDIVGTLCAEDSPHGARGLTGLQTMLSGYIQPVAFAFDTTQITSPQNGSNPKPGDPCHPITAKGHVPAITFGAQNSSHQGDGVALDFCPTLDKSKTPGVMQASAVRRLTPTECERLQGFPDGWTNVPYRGKPASDGPRYNALGNSMAVPVMRWIGERIQMVEDLPC
jgi:DNA (cytosine-5)-methyltransferase 1